MKNDLIKIDLNKCLLFVVYVFIFCVLLFFNQYYVTNPCDDSTGIAMFPQNVYHGKYIVSFVLDSIYGLIPFLFKNIHINTWGQTGGAVFYSILVIILISTLSSLFFIENKKNYLYPLVILVNFIIFYYIFSMVHSQHYYYMFSKTLFCFFLFPFTFLFMFIKKILSILLCETQFNKKDIFVLCVYTLLIGFSSDIISIFTFLFLGILLFSARKFKNITFKNILIVEGTLLSSFFISFCHPSFSESFLFKRFCESFELGFGKFFSIFNEYNLVFIDTFKREFCCLFLIILFFTVLIYCVYKNNDRKYNKINLVLLSVFLLFYFVFFIVLLGYRENIDYIRTNPDYWMQIKFLLLMVINIEAGFLLNEIRNNKKLLIVVSVFLICISSKYVISEINYISDVGIKTYIKEKSNIEEIKDNCHNRYVLEHMLLWYLYNKKPPIILKDGTYFYFWDDQEFASFLICYLYIKNYFSDGGLIDVYAVQYLDTLEEVVEKYYENGGREITENEIEESDFNKLLDENWVTMGREL